MIEWSSLQCLCFIIESHLFDFTYLVYLVQKHHFSRASINAIKDCMCGSCKLTSLHRANMSSKSQLISKSYVGNLSRAATPAASILAAFTSSSRFICSSNIFARFRYTSPRFFMVPDVID